MASVSKVVTISPKDVDEGYTGAVVEESTIYLCLNDLVDKEKEIARLTGEKKKLEKELQQTGRKLANEKFLNNAPAAVVEKEKEKHHANMEKLDKLNQRLEQFSK